jgi:hypothetical protein
MKVMAIGTLKPLSPEQRQRYLSKEVPATLQLYLDGKMEQFGLRDKEAGVIFLMNVGSVDEADRLLKALPLGQANLLTFDLMPIGPLLPLGMLMKTCVTTQISANPGAIHSTNTTPAFIEHRVKQPSSGVAFAQLASQLFGEVTRNTDRLHEMEALDMISLDKGALGEEITKRSALPTRTTRLPDVWRDGRETRLSLADLARGLRADH